MAGQFPSVAEEVEIIKAVASSDGDHPIIMMNINHYVPEVSFPDGEAYREYLDSFTEILTSIGARMRGRVSVLGCVVGDQVADEIFWIWFPSHQVFLNAHQAPGTDRFYAARTKCIAKSTIFRCREADLPN